MNFITKKYIYWAVSLVFMLGIGLSVYSLLGGFEKIEVVHETGQNTYSIAGKMVEGERMHSVEGKTFREVRDWIASRDFKGELCIIDYRPDTLTEGEIKRFIGVLLKDEVSAIPSGYQVLELKSHGSYASALSMHPLVMPNSEKIEKTLRAFAASQGDSLQDLSLEIYYPDNSVLIKMFTSN